MDGGVALRFTFRWDGGGEGGGVCACAEAVDAWEARGGGDASDPCVCVVGSRMRGKVGWGCRGWILGGSLEQRRARWWYVSREPFFERGVGCDRDGTAYGTQYSVEYSVGALVLDLPRSACGAVRREGWVEMRLGAGGRLRDVPAGNELVWI